MDPVCFTLTMHALRTTFCSRCSDDLEAQPSHTEDSEERGSADLCHISWGSFVFLLASQAPLLGEEIPGALCLMMIIMVIPARMQVPRKACSSADRVLCSSAPSAFSWQMGRVGDGGESEKAGQAGVGEGLGGGWCEE